MGAHRPLVLRAARDVELARDLFMSQIGSVPPSRQPSKRVMSPRRAPPQRKVEGARNGIVDMLSAEIASTMSALPTASDCRARSSTFNPDAQAMLTVWAGTFSPRPERSAI
jgi:hypothetical protein